MYYPVRIVEMSLAKLCTGTQIFYKGLVLLIVDYEGNLQVCIAD